MKPNLLINNNSLTENNNNSVKLDDDDMFGTTKNYGTSFCGRPNRPTMISAKYRQKEERRKVLKISINKLKKIEDPESSLRRSVLINNTMKRLQREAREDKNLHKHPMISFRTSCFDIDEPAPRNDIQLADITNLQKKDDEHELNNGSPAKRDSRKRSIEEDGEDVQAVLSQFYMPMTPRMLTSIDEDEDEIVDVVGESCKRPRLEEPEQTAADRLKEAAAGTEDRMRDQNTQSPSYSCGHTSMFNELQSVVYHSLIASLET